MGFSASPQAALLRTWVSWCRSGQLLLRLLGVPSILLALYLEAKGASPKTTSRILSRLSRRLRLSTLICSSSALHDADRDNRWGDIFPQGRDVMSTGALSQRNFDKARRPSGGSASPPSLKETHPGSSTLLPPTPSLPNSQQTQQHQDPPQDDMSSNPRSHNRSQTLSQVDVLRQGKRLSLQFPIQPSTGNTSPAFSPRSRPQSWVAAPSPVPSPDNVSTPETNLLAVVAAQERYVLELKEELGKAEQDLKTLKKYFATQEAMKQRNELRKVTQLQPLNTTLANYGSDQDDEDGSALWMQKEMERRKAILSGTKTSQRKVFSGSKHLRTLSLLSPDKSYTPSFPQPRDLNEHEEPVAAPDATVVPKRNQHPRPPPLTRHSTNSDIANHIAHTVDGERNDLGGLTNIQRDALLRTGKQMATDFKDGLLTFIEDIRQATVGDEPIGGTEASGSNAKPRKPSEARPTLQRTASSKVASKTGDIGDEFWKSHGLSEPKASPTNKRTHSLKHTRTPQHPKNQKHPLNTTVDDEEEWDNWDTPAASTAKQLQHEGHDSSDDSLPPSPVSHQASSRTSTRYHAQRHDSKASLTTSSSAGLLSEDTPLRDAKRNSIPWPDLVKYSPSIKKTAATLMKQFEESLTPPAESRDMSHAQGDYIGRAISPASHPAH